MPAAIFVRLALLLLRDDFFPFVEADAVGNVGGADAGGGDLISKASCNAVRSPTGLAVGGVVQLERNAGGGGLRLGTALPCAA